MKTHKSTFRILFYLKKSKLLHNGEAPIFMRITVKGDRAEIATHRSIQPHLWNQAKGFVTGFTQQSQDLNSYLEILRNKAHNYRKEVEEADEVATARLIADLVQGKGTRRKGVIELFAEHNSQCRERIGTDFTQSTVVRYETTLMHVQDFILKSYRQKEFILRNINPQFIRDFEHYLKTVRKCNHNTTVRYIGHFRKIIRLALANDYMKKDPFRSIRYGLKYVDRPFLSEVELRILIDKKFSNERLQRVKDIFLFCCFTGLAFSDVKDLTSDNIMPDINGQVWLRTKRKKTGNSCEIPLLEIPVAILRKYKDDPLCIRENRLLPVSSNQKMNAYLKEIADVSRINKNLTTHAARHTFATTVTLTRGVSMEAVSKMLGHSDLNTTKQYARIVNTLVSNEMNKIQSDYKMDDSYNKDKRINPPRFKAV